MPARNVVKQYLKNGFYHIYNRGVEKRKIFQSEQDYKVFLSYLKEYLEPKNKTELRKLLKNAPWREKDKIIKRLLINNFSEKIELLAYCLMPNHFHLLIKQRVTRGIEVFMKSLGTRYVMYFNRQHNRVGGLFQSNYKAVLVKTDEQLLHLSRYVHQNPAFLSYKGPTLLEYPYSSLGGYLGKWEAKWLKPQGILQSFSKTKKGFSYKNFVLDGDGLNKSSMFLGSLILE